MNPFEHHGIRHLSPSSLNLFIAQPGIWALRYLGRSKDAGGPKMWCGTAVEAGYAHYLHKGNLEEAHEAATRSYWLNVDENKARGPEADKEAAAIEPMISQALLWTPPSELNATQIKIEHFFDDVPVPVIGYVDLSFEDMDVDLKTTRAMPSKPRPDHVRQVSLYRAARNKPGGLLYVTDKRNAFYAVDNVMMKESLDELTTAARKLSRLLAAFDKSEDVVDALPIDWNDFRAPRRGVPRTTGASEMFDVVELET